tara:strand:- start:4242 stop:4595 length:354 start_codon:yes stop_codon:yes gene_type:complete
VSRRETLSKLVRIGDMLLDKKMQELQIAAAERARNLALLRDLTPGPIEEPQTIAGAQAALRYNRWADARRAEINLVLATRTAEWLQAKADAERALGQAEVLKNIHKRNNKRKNQTLT